MNDALRWMNADDLRALQAGDISKVSTRGLQMLQRASAPATAEKAPDPSEGGSTLQFGPLDTGIKIGEGTTRFLAGVGKGMTDLVRGAGQYVGAVSRKDVDEANARDKPLMNTGAGMVGNFTGQVLPAIPALGFAGAGLLSTAATGAAQGALQPTGTNDSTLGNIAVGGALGAAGPVAVRGARAVASGARALVDPFTAAGRDRIAGRVLQQFADDPARVAAAAQTTGPTRTGSLPTLAEQSGDAGIARLQDSLRALDPQIGNAIESQLAGNNAARVSRLRELAGEGGARDAAVTARQQAAGPQYERAFAQQIDPALAPAGAELLESPAIRQAAQEARTNALNRGAVMDGEGSVRGLHDMKLALDDAITRAESATSPAGANQAASLRAARDRLLGYIETASPTYRDARTAYAAASRPVNAHDVGGELLRRGTSNTTSLPAGVADEGVPRLMPDRFLGALRNDEQLVRQATGRNLGGVADVLDPGQLDLVRRIAGEVDRTAAVGRAGNGPGSATAQRMASQNLIRQIAGPTGLPQSWAESALLTTALRPVQFGYAAAEPALQQVLARAVTDPGVARQLLEAAARRGGGPRSLQQVGGLLSGAVEGGGLLGAAVRPAIVGAGLLGLP